jgi:hypothetical protein
MTRFYSPSLRFPQSGEPCSHMDFPLEHGSRVILHCLEVEAVSRPTVSLPVCLGIGKPPGTHHQSLITVGYLRFSSRGVPTLTRGLVCNLLVQLLLGLAQRCHTCLQVPQNSDTLLSLECLYCLELELNLRPTASWPVHLDVGPLFGARDQILNFL